MYHSESYHSCITTISTVVDVLSSFSTYILFFHWFTGFSLAIPRTLLIYIRSGKFLAVSRSVLPDSLWPHGLYPTRFLCPWDFPILEWVVISFSRGSSWPRGWTWISCISGQLYHLSHQRSVWKGIWTIILCSFLWKRESVATFILCPYMLLF